MSLTVRVAGNWLHRMRFVAATLCIAVLAAGAGYRVIYGPNGMIVYKAKRAEYERLRQDIDEQNRTHQELEDRVRALQSDPKEIEKVARERLGYVKPGETVLVQRQAHPDTRSSANLAQNQPAASQ